MAKGDKDEDDERQDDNAGAGGEEDSSRSERDRDRDDEREPEEDDDEPKRKRSRKRSKSSDDDDEPDDDKSRKGRRSDKDDDEREDSSRSTGSRDDDEDEDGDLPKVARKYKSRMKAADKRAAEREKERDEAREELEDTRIELAVRREIAEGGRRFQDVDLVLDLVRDHVVVKDGEPTKVDEALDWVADRHPYLLTDDDEDDRVEPERPNGRSGPPANKPKRVTSSRPDRETLRRKYSSLRK